MRSMLLAAVFSASLFAAMLSWSTFRPCELPGIGTGPEPIAHGMVPTAPTPPTPAAGDVVIGSTLGSMGSMAFTAKPVPPGEVVVLTESGDPAREWTCDRCRRVWVLDPGSWWTPRIAVYADGSRVVFRGCVRCLAETLERAK